MSSTIGGIVRQGVVVPNSPLPDKTEQSCTTAIKLNPPCVNRSAGNANQEESIAGFTLFEDELPPLISLEPRDFGNLRPLVVIQLGEEGAGAKQIGNHDGYTRARRPVGWGKVVSGKLVDKSDG